MVSACPHSCRRCRRSAALYLVQIIVESAFSESKSVREDFCRSRLEKYSVSGDDIWLDVVEVPSSCLVFPMFLPQLVDVSVNSTEPSNQSVHIWRS